MGHLLLKMHHIDGSQIGICLLHSSQLRGTDALSTGRQRHRDPSMLLLCSLLLKHHLSLSHNLLVVQHLGIIGN
jgi:hypothetical protein